MSGLVRSPAIPMSLTDRIRPVSRAEDRTLPVIDAFSSLLPTGLPRGVTITSHGDAARSFALALTVAAGRSGSWLAVVGLDAMGWQAARELGVATNRVVHVDTTGSGGHTADALAAAVDGFDLVLVGSRVHLDHAIQRRLGARARERGAVLIGVSEPPAGAHRAFRSGPRDSGAFDARSCDSGAFDAVADLRAMTSGSRWVGLGAGAGRLSGRRVEVVMEGRRLPGRRRSTDLWLPGPDGTVTIPIAEIPIVEIRPTPGNDNRPTIGGDPGAIGPDSLDTDSLDTDSLDTASPRSRSA